MTQTSKRHWNFLGLVGIIAMGGTPILAADYPALPKTTPAITAQDISMRDQALADDRFQGRYPGSPSGEAAAQWIAKEMKRIGIKPGNGKSYFQTVPMVTTVTQVAQSSIAFTVTSAADPSKAKTLTPRLGEDIVVGTPHYGQPTLALDDLPVVFAGYGVIAPEYNWNDYAGIDVKGKIVLVLINDPGNEDAEPDPAFFKGKAMTYYGRWTYKFEEAARQGAAGVIIIHETRPAAYGWQVVRNSFSGEKSWLDTPDQGASEVALQGWVTHEYASELLGQVGLDYQSLKQAANRPGFRALPVKDLKFTTHLTTAVTRLKSRNVVGILPGKKRPDEYVLYSAHWDHLGVKASAPGPDKIHHGAVDNAIGVSAILEIGEAMAARKSPPDRSVLFIAWTLEEQGLLGSEYFAANPIYPLARIAGGINLDALLPIGRTRDMTVIGNGGSELEDMLADILKTKGRTVSPNPNPELGGYYRSDHISLAKRGVPMINAKEGGDLLEGGRDVATRLRQAYVDMRYHQPADAFDPNWDLSGMVEDLNVLADFGFRLANANQWPNCYPDNEFRAVRDQSRNMAH